MLSRWWCHLVQSQPCGGILGSWGGALGLCHSDRREKVETEQEGCGLALELGGGHTSLPFVCIGESFCFS